MPKPVGACTAAGETKAALFRLEQERELRILLSAYTYAHERRILAAVLIQFGPKLLCARVLELEL